MDANGRFTLGSDEFTEVIGPRVAITLGRPWNEVNDELVLDPEGQVARAVATHDTWSGITVSWPVDGIADRLKVELSGLPIYDRNRNFLGYRGFGVCRDVDRLATLAEMRRTNHAAAPLASGECGARRRPSAGRAGGDGGAAVRRQCGAVPQPGADAGAEGAGAEPGRAQRVPRAGPPAHRPPQGRRRARGAGRRRRHRAASRGRGGRRGRSRGRRGRAARRHCGSRRAGPGRAHRRGPSTGTARARRADAARPHSGRGAGLSARHPALRQPRLPRMDRLRASRRARRGGRARQPVRRRRRRIAGRCRAPARRSRSRPRAATSCRWRDACSRFPGRARPRSSSCWRRPAPRSA